MGTSTFGGQAETVNSLRKSNIELLRIIAMVFIVAHHFAFHGGFKFADDALSVNRFWIQFLQIGGKIGVDIFILISGFFLVSASAVSTSKIIKTWAQMFFYSFIIFAGFVIVGLEPFQMKDFVKGIAPVIFSRWWFASTYFVLYLLSPYINSLLKTFSEKQYRSYLTVLFLCWCVIPTLTGKTFQSNALLWFVFLYSLAGYFRLFGIKLSLSGYKCIALSFAAIILTFLSAVLFDVLGTKMSVFAEHTTYFYNMQRLPVLFISLFMFIGFSKLDLRYNKVINVISSATFGVYLIHDHRFVRRFLWKTLFRNASYSKSNMLIPYSLLVIGAVFAGCTIIELLRIRLLEKNYMPVVEKISSYIDKKKGFGF